MRYLLQISFLLVCFFPSSSKSQARIGSLAAMLRPAAQKHDLKGSVKVLSQVQSPLSNKKTDWLDGYSGQNYSEEYNEQGLLEKRIGRDDFNQPQQITHYEYDARGQVSAIWIEALADHPLGGRTEGRIDYKFNPVTNTHTTFDKRVIMGNPQNNRTETLVDSLKRVLIERTYKQDTLLISENRSTWDTHGYLTERATRLRNDNLANFKINKADFDNFLKNELKVNLSEQEKKLIDKSLDSLRYREDSLRRNQPEWTNDTTLFRNQYNAAAKLIRQESYRHNQLTDVTSFTYSAQVTRVVRQSYNNKGELTSETISLQHPVDNHSLADTVRHFYDGKWETNTYNWNAHPKPIFQYEYDDHGNWIEKKQVDGNGNQVGVTLVRKLEYYL